MRHPTESSGIPFEPRVSPRVIWLLAAVWGPVVQAIGCLRLWAVGHGDWHITFGILLRALCVPVFVRLAWSARSRARAVAWMAVGGVADFAITTAIFWSGHRAAWYDPKELIWAVGWGAWVSLLAVVLYPTPRRCSHQRADAASALAALWVVLPCIVGAWAYTVTKRASSSADLGFTIDVALRGLLPFALCVLVLLRVLDRKRWAGQVSDGQIAGWRCLEPTGKEPADLPILFGSAGPGSKVLARVREEGSPFRDGELEPVAWVGAARP
ncbi:MAG: hypothetical protein JOZ69_13040 [Myxococcales bacterium]|nr:hypothetical protein [Myxococcales bacterium]